MVRLLQRDSVILVILIILGLALRLDFMLPGNFVIDGDEAIVGLMAKHMNEGAPIPCFYYGQPYMGSFEPIVVSFVFKYFGISNLTLKAVPLFFSLLLIVLVYQLGKEIGGRRVGLVAATLCALPPNTLVVWSGKARGGFIELLVIGACALILACRWLRPGDQKLWRTILVGALLGFGWWVNNQIIFFILPIGFCFAARLLWRETTYIQRLKLFASHITSGLIAFFTGGLPFWIYNFEHDFESFRMFHRATLSDFIDQLAGLFSTAIPIILGAKRFWEFDDLFPYSTVLYYGVYVFIAALIILSLGKALFPLFKLKLSAAPQLELLLLFVFSCFAVFSLSSFGYLVQAPRYLLPVYVGIFPLAAIAVDKIRDQRLASGALVALLVVLNLLSSYSDGRAIPGEPYVYKQQRVAKDHTELIEWLDRNNISWVRTNYWIGYRLAFETQERVKFDLFQEPAQVRIHQYRADALKYGEDRMPFVLVPAQSDIVERALSALQYKFQKVELSGYSVLYNITPLRTDFHPLDHSKYSLSSNYNESAAQSASDDKLDTRWASARPQSKDMRFYATLKEPAVLTGLHYDLGLWPHDWPRALKISIEDPKGVMKTVFDTESYQSIRYLTENNESLSIFFEPQLVSRVILSQVGHDSVFDWSIAELTLFEKNR